MANSPGILERIPELRALTKYRKNEALIRNDGVYVISGIFRGAHEGRAQCAKQAEVSPVSNKSHKHALRAMWIDDCELWVKMHSRPGRWPQIFDLQATG
ncbi:MAG TPA: hypothetical protein IAA84_09600 [Candidatus Alectryocaccomicrobium excrementavium]|uniref:Uncharacterized protein n=1 Tax=Candidatus Alectryocaccomicrobium excrementavium TaxID=2840668 RepID=A0A9D1G184_9FIRM|nr:hypothetical protein [Candidatus Alectryocaccomicrobium excrementavium]